MLGSYYVRYDMIIHGTFTSIILWKIFDAFENVLAMIRAVSFTCDGFPFVNIFNNACWKWLKLNEFLKITHKSRTFHFENSGFVDHKTNESWCVIIFILKPRTIKNKKEVDFGLTKIKLNQFLRCLCQSVQISAKQNQLMKYENLRWQKFNEIYFSKE